MNRIGRRLVLVLSTLGTLLSAVWIALVLWFRDFFPTRLLLLQAVFQVIGGGNTVSVAVLYSVVADVVSEAERSVEA